MKRTFVKVLMVSVLSMFIVACGNSTKATKFSGTIVPKAPTEDAAKADANDSQTKSEATVAEAPAKPGVKLPGQFKCVARDSIWYSVAKMHEATFEADMTDKPMLEVKSEAKELNFKIGRDFIEGQKINQELKPECENVVEHTDVKYEWTYTCRYFVKNGEEERQAAAVQKSFFKISSNGVGQLCRTVDTETPHCWDLSECK